MNEEIEYAEMLEIPVSTVNIIRKKSRKKKEKRRRQEETPLKDSVIAQVNNRLDDTPFPPPTQEQTEEEKTEGFVDFDPVPDRIDTVRLFADEEERKSAYEEGFLLDEKGEEIEEFSENEGGRYALNEKLPKKSVRVALGIEFAAACALCGAIFLTNVFLPHSAMNTFFRAVHSPATIETADNRSYADFTLSPVVSELSDAELTLSTAGVLSLNGDCCIYPAADGKVSEVQRHENGTYTLKIRHSDTFTGVMSGLNQVYYEVGDEVKSNVPVGYIAEDNEVQVTMYSEGLLLNCFQLTEENCLAWLEK